MAEGGKRYRQLERESFGCKSAVVFLRESREARSNGAAGSEERNSATARHVYWSLRQSYFFSTPAQLTAIVAAKQSHYYSLG